MFRKELFLQQVTFTTALFLGGLICVGVCAAAEVDRTFAGYKSIGDFGVSTGR